MNIELISEILVFAIASTFISTQLIQRLKENFKVKKWLPLAIVSLVISFSTGFLFARSFSDLDIKMCICHYLHRKSILPFLWWNSTRVLFRADGSYHILPFTSPP